MYRGKQKKCKNAKYKLKTVRKLVREGKVYIIGAARDTAYYDFGWDIPFVLKAICKLKKNHCYKSAVLEANPEFYTDFYKVNNLLGENVYTHFYIDAHEDKLIVLSFKENRD